MKNSWVSLHTHTQYSILDGASKIPDLVSRAVELDMPALGISDHGNLFGAREFYLECTRQGIKPIIGMEAYVAPESRHTKSKVFLGGADQRKEDLSYGAYGHMLVFAASPQGIRNLYKLHSRSYLEGYYHKPRIDLEILEEHKEGLIITTGCAGGILPTLIRLQLLEEARKYLEKLRQIFSGQLYLEVMDHNRLDDLDLNGHLTSLSLELEIPLLATNDSHYTVEEDYEVHDALLCIQTRATLNDEDRFRFEGSGYHLRSYDEMIGRPLPLEAIEETLRVAERVGDYGETFTHRKLMPSVDIPRTLREIVEDQLIERDLPNEYTKRAEYELEIIESAGYEDYILVAADLVRWARDRGIMVGPGRGSIGGCLVGYLLGIHGLDSLAHNLHMERFLNPERLSPPDIDIDIEPERRDEVIRYAIDTYGSSRVAQIITFGTIQARAALKDANRVLGGSYSRGEELVSLVPPLQQGRQTPLAQLPGIKKADPETYDLALGLEGLIRNTGKHAAGVIISPEDLDSLIPIKKDARDDYAVTGFDQHHLEAMGLIKMDLLGLENLGTIRKTLEIIKGEEDASSTG